MFCILFYSEKPLMNHQCGYYWCDLGGIKSDIVDEWEEKLLFEYSHSIIERFLYLIPLGCFSSSYACILALTYVIHCNQ